jgi:dimethylargininase
VSTTFNRAIVRPPGTTFAQGLTSSGLGAPDLTMALAQHARYCAALEDCGVEVMRLASDAVHPDSTFVEDTAVIWGSRAVLTRPGAPSRQGEATGMAQVLGREFSDVVGIEPPGTLDGGDVCQTDAGVFIGISARTNVEGARQLAAFLGRDGIASTPIDIRTVPGLLHLKSGLSWLGEGRIAVVESLAGHPALAVFSRVLVRPDEQYAANCVRVNHRVLVAAGYPRFEAALAAQGLAPLALEMSEFRKMDGGLSCLSLRFLRG